MSFKVRPQVRGDFAWSMNGLMQGDEHAANVRWAVEDGFQESCISCKNFDETTEQCKKFEQRPPARVIVLSCGIGYEDKNDIPF